jgi:anti-sigma B factor antagonist
MGEDGTQVDDFAITTETSSHGEVWVAVRGELDLSHAAELKELLSRELSDGRTVVLDLSAVRFIDSTGLAAIVTTLNHSKDSDSALQVCAELQPQAYRLMELTGILPLLSLVDCDRRRVIG